MKKLKQVIAMYLAVIMCCLPMSSAVFAADISENEQNQISDGNENVQVDGNDSVGEVLAAAISSEQNEAQSRSQSENGITGLEVTGNTADPNAGFGKDDRCSRRECSTDYFGR